MMGHSRLTYSGLAGLQYDLHQKSYRKISPRIDLEKHEDASIRDQVI